MSNETDFLYFSSPEEAEKELLERRDNQILFQEVRELFGDPPPFLESATPSAIFSRYIASPTLEFDEFLKKVESTSLRPLFLEFTADKFVAKNRDKYGVCRMRFYDNEHPERNTHVAKIVDFNCHEGKPLASIATTHGESLVDFHHRLLKAHTQVPVEIHDFSDWFLPNRGSDLWSYYLRYLSLFLVDAVLFENFLLDTREGSFTNAVVVPAFKTLHDVTGIAPIIVRVIPSEAEEEPHWCYYSKDIASHL